MEIEKLIEKYVDENRRIMNRRPDLAIHGDFTPDGIKLFCNVGFIDDLKSVGKADSTSEKDLTDSLLLLPSALSTEDWRRLACQIDNSFIGTEKTFTSERKIGYYSLSTNACDDASFIRVYCDLQTQEISRIMILGEHTDGWQEVTPYTLNRIKIFLSQYAK